MTPLKALLASLLLLACSAPPEAIPESSAPVMPQQQADLALTRAAATWTCAIGWAPAVATVRYDEPADASDRVAGAWDADAATLILVPLRIGPEQARWDAVVLHELGHAIGLQHLPGQRAIMNPMAEPPACVWQADVLQLRDALGIEARTACADDL